MKHHHGSLTVLLEESSRHNLVLEEEPLSAHAELQILANVLKQSPIL